MKTLLLIADGVIVLFSIWVVVAVVRSILLRRAPRQLLELAQYLAKEGWAGYRVELDLGQRQLKLFPPAKLPDGISFVLSTRENAMHGPELKFFDFGNELDYLLPVRAGSPEAIDNMRRSRCRATLIGPLIRAHGNDFALDVGSEQIVLYLRAPLGSRRLPLVALQELLPKVVAALDELLPAAWYPPVEGDVAVGEGPFRGEVEGSTTDGWMVEGLVDQLPLGGGGPPLSGPFSLAQLAEGLRSGLLSWFTRAAPEGGALAPLTAIEGLRPLRDGPAARRERPALEAPDLPPPEPFFPRFLRFARNPVIFIIASLALLLPGLSARRGAGAVVQGRQSEAWPTVQGEIVQSHLEKRRRKRLIYYRSIIRYRYEVAGKAYEGDRLRFVSDGLREQTNNSEGFPDRTEAEYFVAKFAKGKKVPVYYQPDDPSLSVLIKGEVHGQATEIVVGAIISAVGALYLLLAILAWVVRRRARSHFAARIAAAG